MNSDISLNLAISTNVTYIKDYLENIKPKLLCLELVFHSCRQIKPDTRLTRRIITKSTTETQTEVRLGRQCNCFCRPKAKCSPTCLKRQSKKSFSSEKARYLFYLLGLSGLKTKSRMRELGKKIHLPGQKLLTVDIINISSNTFQVFYISKYIQPCYVVGPNILFSLHKQSTFYHQVLSNV